MWIFKIYTTITPCVQNGLFAVSLRSQQLLSSSFNRFIHAPNNAPRAVVSEAALAQSHLRSNARFVVGLCDQPTTPEKPTLTTTALPAFCRCSETRSRSAAAIS